MHISVEQSATRVSLRIWVDGRADPLVIEAATRESLGRPVVALGCRRIVAAEPLERLFRELTRTAERFFSENWPAR